MRIFGIVLFFIIILVCISALALHEESKWKRIREKRDKDNANIDRIIKKLNNQ